MINKPKLVFLISRAGYNVSYLADYLDLRRETVSRKLSGEIDFRLVEIKKIVKLFRLTEKDVIDVFFCDVFPSDER